MKFIDDGNERSLKQQLLELLMQSMDENDGIKIKEMMVAKGDNLQQPEEQLLASNDKPTPTPTPVPTPKPNMEDGDMEMLELLQKRRR
jgi:hypothetical protein